MRNPRARTAWQLNLVLYAMTDRIDIKGPLLDQGLVCEEILTDLPEWFGIEQANRDYVERVATLPTFVAFVEETPVGFMSLLQHSPQSAELYVLGVRRQYHRHGVGKLLLEASERYLRQQGVKYVQVKTLAALADDENYEKTRAFYEGQGYVPLEVFLELWDPGNPCLQMIKGI